MDFKFKVDTTPIKDLQRQSPVLLSKFMIGLGLAVEGEAKVLVGSPGEFHSEVTGNLKSSIGSRKRTIHGRPAAEIYSTVHHAEYLHEGTGIYGPHKRLIVPINKKALHWGGTPGFFAKSVKGIKPRPFFRKAIENVIPKQMPKIFERVAGKELKVTRRSPR
jgi:hypothetical protein